MRQKLWWLGVAVLVLALAGQYVAYRLDTGGPFANAAWADRSNNFNELANKARNVVQVQVQSVQQGPDVVIPASAEPGGEVRYATQNVVVTVQSAAKGGAKAGQTMTIFRNGGPVTFPTGPTSGGPGENPLRPANPFGPGAKPQPNVTPPPHPEAPKAAPNTPAQAANVNVTEELADDPPYQVGEVYFLALTDGPNGTQRPVSPAGRYKVGANNVLQAVSDDDISASVNGRPASDAAAAAQGRLNIPSRAQVQRRVIAPTPGMPSTGTPADNLVVWLVVAVALAGLTAGVIIRRRRA